LILYDLAIISARQMAAPVQTIGETAAISLDPTVLPNCALRTTLRMLAAMAPFPLLLHKFRHL
jgi:hypothetical protein